MFLLFNMNSTPIIIKMDSITEQERMNEVLEELKDVCAQCIYDQIEYDVGMSETMFTPFLI